MEGDEGIVDLGVLDTVITSGEVAEFIVDNAGVLASFSDGCFEVGHVAMLSTRELLVNEPGL